MKKFEFPCSSWPTCQCREQTGISVTAAEKNVENLSPSECPFGWLSADWLIGLSEDKVTDSFSFDICSDESFSEPVKEEKLFKCTFRAAELLSWLFNVLGTLKQH